MTFLWPASLLGLLAVVAAAAWALYRPTRQRYVIPSLSLWQQALQSLNGRRRATRRLTPAWVCLLAGASLAVLAAAGPTIRQDSPIRRVAIAVYPSAEVDPAMLGLAANRLTNRLDPGDRIQLLLPEQLGGPTGWMTPTQARDRLQRVGPLPISAEQMAPLSAGGEAQHVYHVAATGSVGVSGPADTLIELPRSIAALSVDALDARLRADAMVEVFVALQSHSPDRRQPAMLEIVAWTDAADNTKTQTVRKALTLAPLERVETVMAIPAAVAIEAGAADQSSQGHGFLVRRDARMRRVALVGADWPMARRFIAADPMLEAVSDADKADIVIAHRAASVRGKASLVVNPPEAPPGYRRGGELTSLVLRGRAAVSEDAVTRGVDFDPVAVRSVTPWRASDLAMGKVLLSVGESVLILRNDPAASGDGRPRRVYVAMNPAEENTNFSATEGFVVFMANAMRWLSPGGAASARYEYLTPEQMGPLDQTWSPWNAMTGGPKATVLPWPGLYVDAAGRIEAVSLPGLRGHAAAVDPAAAIDALTLPAPQAVAQARELKGLLTLLAMGLWLTGWMLRTRTV